MMASIYPGGTAIAGLARLLPFPFALFPEAQKGPDLIRFTLGGACGSGFVS